jgi:hypothetical protein
MRYLSSAGRDPFVLLNGLDGTCVSHEIRTKLPPKGCRSYRLQVPRAFGESPGLLARVMDIQRLRRVPVPLRCRCLMQCRSGVASLYANSFDLWDESGYVGGAALLSCRLPVPYSISSLPILMQIVERTRAFHTVTRSNAHTPTDTYRPIYKVIRNKLN